MCSWDLTKKKEKLLLLEDKKDLKLEIRVTLSRIFQSLLLLMKTFQTLKRKKTKKECGTKTQSLLRSPHSLRLLAQLLELQKMELQSISFI